MNKNNIDWRQFASELMWRMVVQHKNEDSWYDIMTTDDYAERGIHNGDISNFRICSYVDPLSHRPLTWKELALELGLFHDRLTPDGHDCRKCPEESTCNAYFKYDTDHERCHTWEQLHPETKTADQNE